MSVQWIPSKTHFSTVKLGFAGVYLFFFDPKRRLRVHVKTASAPPRWGGSNMYPQSLFWAKIRKTSKFFQWKFSFLQQKKKFCILHGRVFLMVVWIGLSCLNIRISFFTCSFCFAGNDQWYSCDDQRLFYRSTTSCLTSWISITRFGSELELYQSKSLRKHAHAIYRFFTAVKKWKLEKLWYFLTFLLETFFVGIC